MSMRLSPITQMHCLLARLSHDEKRSVIRSLQVHGQFIVALLSITWSIHPKTKEAGNG
jgi:hypothetical protein